MYGIKVWDYELDDKYNINKKDINLPIIIKKNKNISTKSSIIWISMENGYSLIINVKLFYN